MTRRTPRATLEAVVTVVVNGAETPPLPLLLLLLLLALLSDEWLFTEAEWMTAPTVLERLRYSKPKR